MARFLRDLRHAARVLGSTPGVTCTAILTLTLGIGANVAMFSVVYGVLLKPLPYQEANRLVLLRAEADYAGANRPVPVTVQSNELAAWRRPFDAIDSVAFYSTGLEALRGDHGAEIIDSAIVSDEFFSTMSGPLLAGRALGPVDNQLPMAVISERLARRLYGDAPAAIGRELALVPFTYTIVGIAGQPFQFPRASVDVWLPAGFAHAVNPRCCGFRAIARLAPDGTIARAEAAARSAFQPVASAPSRPASNVRTSVVRLTDDTVAAVRPALLVLFASVLLVLAIACSNLVNLLLARNAARQREFAVRRALGAPATHLVQQLLVECALLVAAGAALGTFLARPIVVALARLAADTVPRMDAIQIDKPALLFAAGLAAVTTVLTGILPALRAVAAPVAAVRDSARTTTPSGTRRLQRTMCVVQVALAVMLLAGATLMARSLVRLLGVDLGVSTDRVLTTTLNLAFGGARPTDAQALARVERVLDSVAALPGVEAAGVGTSLPPNASRMVVTLRRSGEAVDYQAAAVPVTPGYFAALEMRLLRGRFFTDADDDRQPAMMIMSEGTATRFFGAGDPLGRTMRLPVLRDGKSMSVEMTLVGVTANVKYAGIAAPAEDIVYRPFAQQPWVAPFLVVRTTGDPGSVAPALRRAIADADPAMVTSAITPLETIVSDATAQPQFRTLLLGAMAALALAISAIGLYGVVAYAVAQRTKEIGIRIALGAAPRDVVMMVLKDGVVVAIAGIGAGTLAASLLARVLGELLYGIAPGDPVSFVGAALGLLALTLVASYLPARRAARIDPIQSLRL